MKKSLSLVLTLAMLATVGWTVSVSGDDEGPSTDRATITKEQRKQNRKAAQEQRRRYENVRFITASPVTTPHTKRLAAPPSTTVIEYDNNNPVQRASQLSVVVGNQFNVGGGGNPIVGPWTITGFVAQNAGTAFPSSTPAATVVFFGGPGTGTTAPLLAVLSSVPLDGGLNGFSLATPLSGSGSFLAGVVNSTYTGCAVTSVPPATTCDGVALDTAQNSTNPLGFHAMSFQAFVDPATGFTPRPGENAIFKVLGSSLPVELMSFSVDAD